MQKEVMMNEQIEIVEEKAQTVIDPVMKFGRKVVFFGLGTVGLAADSVKGLVSKSGDYSDKLIERGEKLATDSRGYVSKMAEGRQDMAKDTVKKAGDTFEKYSEQVLTRVHIPTSEDIDTVTKKVASIERKLDKAIKDGVTAEPKTKVPA
jgi:polyhydroxyalkanoate synthesis regulator phasin